MDRSDTVINKNPVYGFGMHPIVRRFRDRCAELSMFRAQRVLEDGLDSEMDNGESAVWTDSKANEAFDNNTGIELDARWDFLRHRPSTNVKERGW